MKRLKRALPCVRLIGEGDSHSLPDGGPADGMGVCFTQLYPAETGAKPPRFMLAAVETQSLAMIPDKDTVGLGGPR